MTEELNNQLNIIKTLRTLLTPEQAAQKADLEKSLLSLKKLRKGLAVRITQEKEDAQQRLLAAKKRVDATNKDPQAKKVFKPIKYFNKDGKEKTLNLTRNGVLETAQKAVQNEVDRLDELEKLTKKKQLLARKRGALFGGEIQRIDRTKDIPIHEFAQRKLVQDSRPMRVIGGELQKRAQGKAVAARQTRLVPKPAAH
jgi:hypothetical protein